MLPPLFLVKSYFPGAVGILFKILRSSLWAKLMQLSFFLLRFSSTLGTKSEKFTFESGSSKNCYLEVLNISVDSFQIRFGMSFGRELSWVEGDIISEVESLLTLFDLGGSALLDALFSILC